MKRNLSQPGRKDVPRSNAWACCRRLVVLLLLLLGWLSPAGAQVTVSTIAGGPIVVGGPASGFRDGDSLQDSQFNQPYGLALGPDGNLYVADKDNNAVRRLRFSNDTTTTLISTGLDQPVDVALDAATNLYVLNQGSGTILEYDLFLNLLGNRASGLTQPTAMVLDSATNLYVTELNGDVLRVSPGGSPAGTVIASGFQQPEGIAILNDGRLVVADTGNQAIRVINPDGSISLLAGGNGAGFTDGDPTRAQFNDPYRLAVAPNGVIVVADRGNNRVRLVTTNGVTTTLYGIDSNLWFQCSSCYPGWADGPSTDAEAREPVGIAVSADGTVFASEVYYDLIREATGANLVPGGGGGGGSTNIVAAPSIQPGSGYYPEGVDVRVSSSVPDVYYTTDGSDPTTNSPRVVLSGNAGIIHWNRSDRDLTSLRLRAFSDGNASEVVGGRPDALNEIGFPRDEIGGVGATVVVPVVLNLQSNVTLRSIQFRVGIAPDATNIPPVSDQFSALEQSTNDFIRVAGTATDGRPSQFTVIPFQEGTARELAMAAVGTNANFTARQFAVVALLKIPVPPQAQPGDRYRLFVTNVTATADGFQEAVPMQSMPDRFLVISNAAYLVGDGSPSGWYNAGDFGDGDLGNADANTAFLASLGLRRPFPFTDLFNALDAFPEDTPGAPGGDGQIRYLDWQIILFRSLRLETNNWRRSWSSGGVRINDASLLNVQPDLPVMSSAPPGEVWYRQATLQAGSTVAATGQTEVSVPLWVNVHPGASISGMEFLAKVLPLGAAPPLTQSPLYVPAPNLPSPTTAAAPPDAFDGAWSLGSFQPPLTGSNALGSIHLSLPPGVQSGDRYVIRFTVFDASPDLKTAYAVESVPGCVSVDAPIPNSLAGPISDDWKIHFFGSDTNVSADAAADPDGDGVPNWAEFLSGTNPTNALSKLQWAGPPARSAAPAQGIVLRWLSAPGKNYTIESSSIPGGTGWTNVVSHLPGDGQEKSFVVTNPPALQQYYRLQVDP